MRLYQLKIKNFRGLKGDGNIIKFDKSNIIFLIGQNNVGKSTFLRGYEFFVNSKQNAKISDFYDYNLSLPIEMEGWFIHEDEDVDDENYTGKGKTKDPEWIHKWVDKEGFIRVRKTWTAENCLFKKQTYSPIENEWKDNGFGGFDSLFTKAAPLPIAINAMEDEDSLNEKVNKLMQDRYLKKVRETQSKLYEDALEKIQMLEDALTGSEEISRLNAELNSHFKKVFSELSLKIQAQNVKDIKLEDLFKKNHTISVERSNTKRPETFLQNGHGVIRQALFNFITFLRDISEASKKEYLILYEEPELFLHPKVTFKLRNSLYDLAKDSPYQILCATHSPLMIDVSQPHASLVRTVKGTDETTKTFQIGEDVFNKDEDYKEYIQMINRFNPHICEAFYADKVILVEGDTEAIVYRALLKHYYPDEEIFVLNTGSKNNMPFFQEILTAFRIEHYIIHDVDTEFNCDGKRNSAWTLNLKIWNLVVEANKQQEGLARRYVHNVNFENAHRYKLQGGKNKPLQASRFVDKVISGDIKNPDCKLWLDDIIGAKSILHDMDYIESRKKSYEDILDEKKSYFSLVED